MRGVGDVSLHAIDNGVVKLLRLQNNVPHLRRNLITSGRLSEKQVAIIHVRVQCKLISRDGGGRLLMSGSNKCGGLICGVFMYDVTSIYYPDQYSSYRCR